MTFENSPQGDSTDLLAENQAVGRDDFFLRDDDRLFNGDDLSRGFGCPGNDGNDRGDRQGRQANRKPNEALFVRAQFLDQ